MNFSSECALAIDRGLITMYMYGEKSALDKWRRFIVLAWDVGMPFAIFWGLGFSFVIWVWLCDCSAFTVAEGCPKGQPFVCSLAGLVNIGGDELCFPKWEMAIQYSPTITSDRFALLELP